MVMDYNNSTVISISYW